MSGYVITVLFRVKSEFRAAFREAILANAAASVRDEPGCSVFDVCGKADGEIFLYEVYANEAAFKDHLATPHYEKFNELVTPWVELKQVTTLARLAPPSP